jgi:hypothetical protein
MLSCHRSWSLHFYDGTHVAQMAKWNRSARFCIRWNGHLRVVIFRKFGAGIRRSRRYNPIPVHQMLRGPSISSELRYLCQRMRTSVRIP